MDVINENIVKFIESLIVDDYSKASKHLTTIVNEKVKDKIKKAMKKPLFGKSKKAKSKVKAKTKGAVADKDSKVPSIDPNKGKFGKGLDKADKSKGFKPFKKK